mgnify:CR=1 FL=1
MDLLVGRWGGRRHGGGEAEAGQGGAGGESRHRRAGQIRSAVRAEPGWRLVVADAAQLASLADETPEGRSIVVLAKQKFNLRERDVQSLGAQFVHFSAQTRMSGVDLATGDGGTAQGDYNEAMVFANTYRTPQVFFLQNNQWAISMHSRDQMASENVAIKAKAYGIPGFYVDGNDIVAVMEVCTHAAEWVRAGNGPALVECLTYRVGSHSNADADAEKFYRTRDEVNEWLGRDPITRIEALLEGLGQLISTQERADIIAAMHREVDEAVLKAEAQVALRHPPAKQARRARGSGSAGATGRGGRKAQPQVELSERDMELLRALKEKRTDLAQAQNVPAYVIFPDKTLIEMAMVRPSNLDQMAEIGGVGARKLEKYGAVFLDVVLSH